MSSQDITLETLTPAIELYNSLIGLERYDNALDVFERRLALFIHNNFDSSRHNVELLEMLFPDGLGQMPLLSQPKARAYVLNQLAIAFQGAGQPGRAVLMYQLHNTIEAKDGHKRNLSKGLSNLSYSLRLVGMLYKSEIAARRSLVIEREEYDNYRRSEGFFLGELGLTLAVRGVVEDSKYCLRRALWFNDKSGESLNLGSDYIKLAQRAVWTSELADALLLADRAWELANNGRSEGDLIRAAHLQGAVALGLNDLVKAEERLHLALTRARAVNFIEQELPVLVALAKLRQRQGDLKAARELLDDLWESAERGPYLLFNVGALNMLAQIERDAGNHTAAVEAATKAYRIAWCDGPPFAYHWGLVAARKHLGELGASEPQMPLFDESKRESIPDVEINPKDKFYVDEKEGK
jgi:tetratricopeptide (TPR) repeat protein